MRGLKIKLLNRLAPVVPVHKEMVKHKERKYVKVKAPFLDELSGLGIIKLLGLSIYDTLTMPVKCKEIKQC